MELVIVCIALVGLLGWRERQNMLERRDLEADKRLLMLRIDSPEKAAIVTRERKHSPPSLPYDNDAAFHAARQRMTENSDGAT